mmetsp:Transcript_48575/g.78178  ORF Transcript_48575/g.78178 Transcript_48575/m.78178 type:complete len:83 (+) Transcript_48575:108-356(+)
MRKDSFTKSDNSVCCEDIAFDIRFAPTRFGREKKQVGLIPRQKLDLFTLYSNSSYASPFRPFGCPTRFSAMVVVLAILPSFV